MVHLTAMFSTTRSCYQTTCSCRPCCVVTSRPNRQFGIYGISFGVGDVPTPSLWSKRKGQEKKRVSNESSRAPVSSSTTVREFAEEVTRKLDTEIFRMKPVQYEVTVTAILPKKESPREDVERDREQVREDEARKKAIFKKEKLFNPVTQSNWPQKKTFKRLYKQWHQTHEAIPVPEREREQVIPLSAPAPLPRRQPVKTSEPRLVEMYRPTRGEIVREEVAREEVVREETTEATEMEPAYRQRWKQTRVRPQRPGANALLYTTTQNQLKKAAVASINLDKEDIDQLFRDTGFKLPWRVQGS